jgi:hypothetical protein
VIVLQVWVILSGRYLTSLTMSSNFWSVSCSPTLPCSSETISSL